jgi:hypothetical protein
MKIHWVFASFAVLIACTLVQAADAPTGSWSIDVTPNAANTIKGSTTAYPDVLSIKDGKLSSQMGGKQGFAPGAYTLKTDRGKTTVSADLVSPKHGKNHYEFDVQQGVLTGKMVWSKTGEDGKPKEAEFTLKSAKK